MINTFIVVMLFYNASGLFLFIIPSHDWKLLFFLFKVQLNLVQFSTKCNLRVKTIFISVICSEIYFDEDLKVKEWTWEY